VRRLEEGEDQGPHPEDADQDGEPHAEDRPVCVHPPVGVDGTDGSDREQRGHGQGHADGQCRPHHDGADDAGQPVELRRQRVGPDGAHDDEILFPRAQLAGDHLDPEEQRRQDGNGAEGAERQRFGADGLRGLGLELGGDLEVREVALGRVPPALDGRDARRPAPHLHAEIDERLRVGRQGPGQRRRSHDVGGKFRDLVLHHLPVQQADADDFQREAAGRCRPTIDRDGDGLPEVQTQRRRRALRHHDLVDAGGVRHPPTGDGETILVEEEAVDAADEEDVAVEAAPRHPPGMHERGGQRLVALDVLTCG
jgi:hypothetical protein